jgi:uncharacterized protein
MATAPAARRWLAAALSLVFVLGFAAAQAKQAGNSTPISLWKVTAGAGHTLYLAGSMHALTQADMPLPDAFTRAFDASDRLVEELDYKELNQQEVTKQALAMGLLQDSDLASAMGKKDWAEVQKLAQESGIELYHYERFKPWLAAIGVADTLLLRYGYQPQLGLDLHFANLAQKRNMPGSGLETVAEQLSFFNDMKPEVQRRFLLQTLREAGTAKRDLGRLHDAWARGDVKALESLQKENFKGFPELRKRLINERNQRWLPHLLECLHGGQTCFVVVGVEHMVGSHGLITLMEARGAKVRQMHEAVHATNGKAK